MASQRPLFASPFDGFGPIRVVPAEEPPPLGQVWGRTPEVLRHKVREVAQKVPGVYGMLDAAGELLYIGKSKSLRSRLLSYFRELDPAHKARRLISRTASIVWERLPSEFAALLRELELIRRFRPKYNVQGQPDRLRRSFLCIGRPPVPYVYLAPRPTGKVLDSFGPIPGTWRAREAVRHLNDLFQLRDCSEKQPLQFSDQADLFATVSSPGCLRHELGTCLGPCIAATSRNTYSRRVRAVRAFLNGTDRSLLSRLEAEMFQAAGQQQFERAAVFRDRWEVLSGLSRNLDRLQEARQEYAFVYPLADIHGQDHWHLIRGGQVEKTVRPPSDAQSAAVAEVALREVFDRPTAEGDPTLLERVDLVWLLVSWFGQDSQELSQTFCADEALKRCRQYHPADCWPASETPASETPASKTPASKTPASKTPASKTPASKTTTSPAPTSASRVA